MKTFLLLLLAGFGLSASAQTVVKTMQTADNEKTLELNVVGTRDGQPFRHHLHFDVQGLTMAQRDSLHRQALHTLSLLGIENVPGMKRFGTEKQENETVTGAVVLRCETCPDKGRIEIYGPNQYVQTRSFNSRRDPQPFFPFTFRSTPGEYRLVYVRKGARRMESAFTVKAGATDHLTVK